MICPAYILTGKDGGTISQGLVLLIRRSCVRIPALCQTQRLNWALAIHWKCRTSQMLLSTQLQWVAGRKMWPCSDWYAILSSFIIILHTVICDHCGRLDYTHFGYSYGLSASRQHPIYIKWCHMAAQSATRVGTTEPYPFMGIGSFTMPGDDSPTTRDLRLYWNPNQSCVQTGNWTHVDCVEVQKANHSASNAS